LLFGKSKATEELSSARASQYMEFISVKQIYLHHINKFLSIPCSKSEIFNSNDLNLFEKQKLLNFIYAVMKIKNKVLDVNTTVEFKKDNEVENKIYEEIMSNINNDANEFINNRFANSPLLQKIIKIILASIDPNFEYNVNITLDDLTDRIYKYLNSLSVYGNTPFIVPIYGSSEFSQALCRMSSVFGSIFIVNDTLEINVFRNNENLVDPENKKFILQVHDKSKNSILII
jgi:RAB protein geranylgeranyltransferase component A